MSYQSVVLADSPVGFWTVGETTATDLGSGATSSSGIPQNISYQNSPTLGQASLLPADAGHSVLLDGVNDFLLVGATGGETYALGDTFSYECWFSLTDVTVFQCLTAGSGFGAGFSPAVTISDSFASQLELEAWSSAEMGHITSTLVNATVYHAIWSKATSTNKIFINGVDVTGTITNHTFGNPTPGGGDWVWGIGPDEVGQPVKGYMQYPAIYSTALSLAQAQAHYTAGTVAAGQYYHPSIQRLRNPRNIH